MYAGREDLARAIQYAPDARSAKRESQNVTKDFSKRYDEDTGLVVMHELVRVKVDQCQPCRNALRVSGSAVITESTADPYWGCGISSPKAAEVTKPEFFPGKNHMGYILTEVRDALDPNWSDTSQADSDDEDEAENFLRDNFSAAATRSIPAAADTATVFIPPTSEPAIHAADTPTITWTALSEDVMAADTFTS